MVGVRHVLSLYSLDNGMHVMMSKNDSLEYVGDHDTEDEVQFVSAGVLRPVLECIDLLSDEDEVGTSVQTSSKLRPKDHVDRQKERVTSTLDQLAHHVAVEKQEREEKDKAFKEKVDSQHAHGLQELEFIEGLSHKEEAKRCVDHWLQMPGLRPGSLNSGYRDSLRCETLPNMKPVMCPILHCNRMFDNGQLLVGHLKRFDHSPCDPTITLKGAPSISFACIACSRRYPSEDQYNVHRNTKIKSVDADGHNSTQHCQEVQCFACPFCFLLFNVRDQCLQHMSAKNHFQQSIKLSETEDTPAPIPIPAYAKKLLISLCKEVPFQITCTACKQVLNSYVEVTAHFRTACKNAGPIAVSHKSVVQVAEVFRVKGHCLGCSRLFTDESQMKSHEHLTRHKVEVVSSMEKAVLLFCDFYERSKNPPDLRLVLNNVRPKSFPLKRPLKQEPESKGSGASSAKRMRASEGKSQETISPGSRSVVSAFFCECNQHYNTEVEVEKHIIAINQIFYKCAVCGKQAGDLAVIGLHMSRFHGGAHLNNFLFWCQICKIEMPRKEDILSHVMDSHDGHGFCYEKKVLEEVPSPSTSKSSTTFSEQSGSTGQARTPSLATSDPAPSGKWLCRICEELFVSEKAVYNHCKEMNNHRFQKYVCGYCKQRFLKVETLYRHFQDEHEGEIDVKYFCGLCDGLQYDMQEEFLNHYQSYHSKDYVFVAERNDSPLQNQAATDPETKTSCRCKMSCSNKSEKQIARKKCLKNLIQQSKLWFRCRLCIATSQTLEAMQKHTKIHGFTKKKSKFLVCCGSCTKRLSDLNGGHNHYFSKHCFPQAGCTVSPASKTTSSGVHASPMPKGQQPSCTPDQSSKSGILPGLKGNEKCEKPAQEESKHELPDMDYLMTTTHIVFVDLDNWPCFFSRLPGYLNQGIFVWGFQGGKNIWRAPDGCKVYNYLVNTGCFFLHPRCSDRKDAADFAICVHAGRLDEQLPKHIQFTILSGDKGFHELELQFLKTMRTAHILNPHQLEGEMMCALLNSITDIGKDRDDMKTAVELSLKEKNNKGQEIKEAIKRSLEEI
ncbi:E3 SUMO-protein ligase ZNF451-like isoform X3 [Acipenser ruthenus]|uniref:E3 SUMO-protein ligase ZNF451-like isoform X3 n=1 Tax=Acipenser ruthenus TaxID=7906 RepID=UPI0027404C67|nr:E3 SUMO-protein ligase ZNF451-like isoform X3 [Acipenser ruthenus]